VNVSFRPSALQALQQYRWPGNVRELANLVERMAIQLGGAAVRVDDLPAKYRPADWVVSAQETEFVPEPAAAIETAVTDDAVAERVELLNDVPSAGMELPPGGMDLREFLESLEQRLIIKALGASAGTVAQAAILLGLRRTTLAEKMRKYGLGSSRETGNVLPAQTGT
jgi:sigma-54 specific flagellar transcriptional regulator A